MAINKHLSFYMRNGWGTKILDAVKKNDHIFSPSNEQTAVDEIGLGRVMIRALRYWSVAMGLTKEEKDSNGIIQVKTPIFDLISNSDHYFQDPGSLLVLHRNLVLNENDSTAWYWLFNEWDLQTISKEEFSDAFHSYLMLRDEGVKKDSVDKEFNCVRSTYVSDASFDIKKIMDEDTFPFLGPLGVLSVGDDKRLVKKSMTSKDIPLELLIYFIAEDNPVESASQQQISVDKLVEEKKQVGKYLNIRYSRLLEMLLEAENKGYISLTNNFGNRFIEFLDVDYSSLINKYYAGKDE